MKKKDYDFSGYATKNNLLCSDGRVIRRDAFKNCDGKIVPLVWNHGGRADPRDIIGHALLENRKDGVYSYGYFNDSDTAKTVKRCVDHGDITGLSIYANSLKQKANEVMHGVIRELSLVLIGANPGATIDYVVEHSDESHRYFELCDLEHSDGLLYYLNGDESEFQNASHSITHSDDEEETNDPDDAENAEDEVEEAESDEEDPEDDDTEDSDDNDDEEDESLEHADGEETEIEKVVKTLNDKQRKAVAIFLETMVRQRGIDLASIKHADPEASDSEEDEDDLDEEEIETKRKETVEALKTLSDEQKAAVLVLLDSLIEEIKPDKSVKHSDDEDDLTEEDLLETAEDAEEYLEDEEELDDETEDETEEDESEKETTDMKKNAFEHSAPESTADYTGVMEAALADLNKSRSGKLSDAIVRHAEEYGLDGDVLQHAYPTDEFGKTITYGISDIHYLFPDAKAVPNEPTFIQRNMEWVSKFLNNTKHSPFSRVKSIHFDITADEARAKGYIKGARKEDEVMVLLKRKTDPCTIYKKQKLDRDDKLDITNFNVVDMMKKELSVMVDEEVARAGLIGDGRNNSATDKIPELNIRPIYNDDALYSIKVTVQVPSDATEDEVAKAVIKACIKGRKQYKGSGRPMFFINPDILSDMLLLEDGIGRSLYDTEASLASKLRVSELVEVPIFEDITREKSGKTLKLVGIIINPIDYNYGTDRGGEKTLLEGFDIDYNQEKYLLETRCSGALVTPYSAMVVEIDASGDPIHTSEP